MWAEAGGCGRSIPGAGLGWCEGWRWDVVPDPRWEGLQSSPLRGAGKRLRECAQGTPFPQTWRHDVGAPHGHGAGHELWGHREALAQDPMAENWLHLLVHLPRGCLSFFANV